MSSTTSKKMKTGEWVLVKPAEEIRKTLDANGALDGLPFMPEMLEYCGRRLQVRRRAEKVCVEYPGGGYKIRELTNNDVVILEISRCTGANHDGCGRACNLLWKTAWLQCAGSNETGLLADLEAVGRLRSQLNTVSSAGAYICQSSQLDAATTFLPRSRVILKCFSEVLSGSRGPIEMAGMILATLWRYSTARFAPRMKVGSLKRTPVGDLNLQPGDLVRIKSEAEIVETLDHRACNRGLRCDGGMREFCGGEFRVRNRLERMISEATGEMRVVESTVILEGLQCLCHYNHIGGCPREDYMYWREIWLEKVEQNGKAS